MWLRTVREARARRQLEHGEIVARLRGDSGVRRRESRWCQLGCCGACQCLWIHVDDEDLEAAELRASDEAARLERESCDENYRIDPAQLTLGPVLGKGGDIPRPVRPLPILVGKIERSHVGVDSAGQLRPVPHTGGDRYFSEPPVSSGAIDNLHRFSFRPLRVVSVPSHRKPSRS